MTNSELRRALLERLGITPQALSQRVQKLKRKNAITTEEATYVIAQKEGIILDRYLTKDAVRHIRTLLKDIASIRQDSSDIKKIQSRSKKTTDRRSILISREFEGIDPILPEKKLLEAREMAAIYPLLYILENSIREVIDKIMSSRHGSDWFNAEAPQGLRRTVNDRMAGEENNSWHQRRGARPIDYLDLNQLVPLMRKIEAVVVPAVIPSMEWFSQLIEEVYQSRCVICHMNPLDRDNIQSVKLRLRQWQKQVKAKKGAIA